MADRLLRNTPSTVTVTFLSDETPIDPDGNAVAVSITKADGSVHTSSTPATRIGVGQYKYNLPGQSALQQLTLAWTGLISGLSTTLYTYVEIVGGYTFSVAQLRAYDSVVADPLRYSYAQLVDARLNVEDEFERICHRAFVPRFGRKEFEGDGGTELWFDDPDIYHITKLTIDGVDHTSWEASGYIKVDSANTKLLYLPTRGGQVFPVQSVIVVEYEHGRRQVPVQIHDKAKKRARGFLTMRNRQNDERATVITPPAGSGFSRINMATPGMDMGFGRYVRSGMGVWHTGIPDIDVVLDDWIYEPEGVA